MKFLLFVIIFLVGFYLAYRILKFIHIKTVGFIIKLFGKEK